MLFTKGKGAADSVDELKKQATAAAVTKAVEVINAGGTQAEAAAAANGVATEILAKGQQQMPTKKAGGTRQTLNLQRITPLTCFCRHTTQGTASDKPTSSSACWAQWWSQSGWRHLN